MITFLGCLSLVLVALLAIMVVFFWKAKREVKTSREDMARYAEIVDIEKYREDVESKLRKSHANIKVSKAEVEKRLRKTHADVKAYKEDTESRMRKARADIDKHKEDMECKTRANIDKYKEDAEARLRKVRELLPKFETLAEMEQHKIQLTRTVAEYEQAHKQWQSRISAQEANLEQLSAQTDAVEETLDMQSFGLYHPKYGFEDSERYANQLKTVRGQQKSLIKSNRATHCPQQWTVDGSTAKGNKMVKEHAKIMLRAFNGECDAAVGKVKYNNVNNLETRIQRSFEAINKLGESKQLWLTQEYLKFKLQELYLVHEHREKVQEEREEQREIKEQMREEEKAARELEKAKRDAEQEEATKTKALEKARNDVSSSHGKQTDRLKAIVDKLEAELKGALERKAKAMARAQLTRSGHVYVLSNVGSFGNGVFKIGMTRRLEPLDRVKELGDASVPFLYDVHAMIYSEDAPTLEKMLHQHFADRRVNLSNLRREFFHVTLDEIREAVHEHFGEVTFVTSMKAEEYRRTLSIRKDAEGNGDEGHGVNNQPSNLPRSAHRTREHA